MMLVSLLAVSLQSAAAAPLPVPEAWVVLARHDRGQVAVDRSTVVRDSDGAVHYWAMVAPKSQKSGYQINLWTVDCEAQSFSVSVSVDYARNGAVRNKPTESNVAVLMALDPLPSEGPVRAVADAVCSDRWGDEPALPSALAVYRTSLADG